MTTKAKCKLCQDIIQIGQEDGYVKCSCGEIGLHRDQGTNSYYARDWDNFFFVDDKGNEIIPTIKKMQDTERTNVVMNRQQMLEMLDKFVSDIEALPPLAMQTYINHYDYLNLLTLIRALFKDKE